MYLRPCGPTAASVDFSSTAPGGWIQYALSRNNLERPTMFSEADLRRLTREINDAAYDSCAWESVLADLRCVMNATTAGFICVSGDGQRGAISLFTGLDKQGIADYAEHFSV